ADDAVELLLNNTWRPALAITGAAGLPLPADGGNVLRPETTVKLSLRVPPTCDAERAAKTMKDLLEKDPPYGAKVTYQGDGSRGAGARGALHEGLRARPSLAGLLRVAVVHAVRPAPPEAWPLPVKSAHASVGVLLEADLKRPRFDVEEMEGNGEQRVRRPE